MIIKLNSYSLANKILNECQASYSYDGAQALAEFFDENSENEEFDAVIIRSEWGEYKSAIEAAGEYGWEADDDDDDNDDDDDEKEEKREKQALSFLEDNTTILVHDSGVTIFNF
jgi:hypothetical protein